MKSLNVVWYTGKNRNNVQQEKEKKRKKKVYCVMTNTLGFLSLTNILGLEKKSCTRRIAFCSKENLSLKLTDITKNSFKCLDKLKKFTNLKDPLATISSAQKDL